MFPAIAEAPESALELAVGMLPSDDDLDRLRRCVRDSLSVLMRCPGSLRQQLVLHLQRISDDGGVSLPVQRLLRAVVHEPPRTSSGSSYGLMPIAAEWNCKADTEQRTVTRRSTRVLSDVSDNQVLSVDSGKSGTTAASCYADGSVTVWDLRSDGVGQQALTSTHGKVLGLSISGNGRMLATFTEETVELWDLEISRVVLTLPPESHANHITSVTVNDDASRIATGCGDCIIRVFSIQGEHTRIAAAARPPSPTGPLASMMATVTDTINSLRSAADPEAALEHAIVPPADSPAPEPVVNYSVVEAPGHTEWVTGISMSASGAVLASSADHELLLWACEAEAPAPAPAGSGTADAVPLPTGEGPAAGDAPPVEQATLAFTSRVLPLESLGSAAVVEQAEVGRDGKFVAVRFRSDGGSGIALWESQGVQPTHVLRALSSPLHDLKLAERHMLSCSDDGELVLWGWAGGEIAAVSKFVTRGAINTCALR